MVVPVPVVLHEGDVKTLPREAFEHTDCARLAAPRRVLGAEPVSDAPRYDKDDAGAVPATAQMAPQLRAKAMPATARRRQDRGAVRRRRVQHPHPLGDGLAGLETLARENHYKIPDGAEPLLRPYVEAGSKFFVAKVDPKKVQMVDGHAALSPLRFHYDSDEFSLPIRLGMANSSRQAGPDRQHHLAEQALRGRELQERVHPDELRRQDRASRRASASSTRRCSTRPSRRIPARSSPSTRGRAVPNYHCDPCTDADITNPDLMTLGGDIVGGEIAAATSC